MTHASITKQKSPSASSLFGDDSSFSLAMGDDRPASRGAVAAEAVNTSVANKSADSGNLSKSLSSVTEQQDEATAAAATPDDDAASAASKTGSSSFNNRASFHAARQQLKVE